jgi:hypothetical protein
MNSSMIGKIEKARRYAQEPERICITHLAARFHGSNDDYDLRFADGQWHCGCHTFEHFGSCAHIMAAQRLLEPMLPADGRYERTVWTTDPGSSMIGKLDKARRYAEEPERFALTSLDAAFTGNNAVHDLTVRDGQWRCACYFFGQIDACAHVLAAQRLLAPMLPATARYESAALAATV